jgi:hypothetical protein
MMPLSAPTSFLLAEFFALNNCVFNDKNKEMFVVKT